MSTHPIHRFATKVIGLWLILVIFSILFWEPILQENSMSLIGLIIYPDYNAVNFPNGAGVSFGSILYSNGYIWPASLVWCLLYLGLVINYAYINPVLKTDRIRKARYLWIIAFSLILIWFLPLSIPVSSFRFSPIIVVISTITLGIIPLKYPEGVLITKGQLSHILKIYDELIGEHINLSNQGHEVLEYLELIENTRKSNI